MIIYFIDETIGVDPVKKLEKKIFKLFPIQFRYQIY